MSDSNNVPQSVESGDTDLAIAVRLLHGMVKGGSHEGPCMPDELGACSIHRSLYSMRRTAAIDFLSSRVVYVE